MKRFNRYLILFALASICIQSYGQGINDMGFGLSFTPFNYSIIKSSQQGFDSLVSARNELEDRSYALALSLKMGFKVKPKLLLDVGIGMSYLASQSRETNSSSQYFNRGNHIAQEDYLIRYAMVDLPINIRYSIVKGRMPLLLVSGLSLSHVIRRDIVTTLTTNSGEQIRTTNDVLFGARDRSWTLSGQLGLQVEFDVKKIVFRTRSSLIPYFQVNYRMMFTNLWKDSLVEKYHGLDIGCGVRYRLDKTRNPN